MTASTARALNELGIIAPPALKGIAGLAVAMSIAENITDPDNSTQEAIAKSIVGIGLYYSA